MVAKPTNLLIKVHSIYCTEQLRLRAGTVSNLHYIYFSVHRECGKYTNFADFLVTPPVNGKIRSILQLVMMYRILYIQYPLRFSPKYILKMYQN
jgi:hypothetical protein